jgi:hypothetical protein
MYQYKFDSGLSLNVSSIPYFAQLQTEQLPNEEIRILVDTSIPRVVILPYSALFPVRNIKITIVDSTGLAGANNITVQASLGAPNDNINGSPTYFITNNFQATRFELLNTNEWAVINGAAGGGGAPLSISLTYLQLVAAIGANGLVTGQKILLTDYQTAQYIPFSGASPDGIGGEEVNLGVIEPLLLTAISSNEVSLFAESTLFPQDIILYRPIMADRSYEYAAGQGKGCIIFRQDALNNVSRDYDYRNVVFRRWETVVGNGVYLSHQKVVGAAFTDYSPFYNLLQTQDTAVRSPLGAGVLFGYLYQLDNTLIIYDGCLSNYLGLSVASTYNGLLAAVPTGSIFALNDFKADNFNVVVAGGCLGNKINTFQLNRIGISDFSNADLANNLCGSVINNEVVVMSNNVMAVIGTNTCYSIDDNSGSQISNNSNPLATIVANIVSYVQGNTSDNISGNYADEIKFNNCNVKDNYANKINRNTSGRDIDGNIATMIEDNSNAGIIRNNTMSDAIRLNSMSNGSIENNIGVTIYQNTNTGAITNNIVTFITDNLGESTISNNRGTEIKSNNVLNFIDSNNVGVISGNVLGAKEGETSSIIKNVGQEISGNNHYGDIAQNNVLLITGNSSILLNTRGISFNVGFSIQGNIDFDRIDFNNVRRIFENNDVLLIQENSGHVITGCSSFFQITNNAINSIASTSGNEANGIVGCIGLQIANTSLSNGGLNRCNINYITNSTFDASGNNTIFDHTFIDGINNRTIFTTLEMATIGFPSRSIYDAVLAQHYIMLLSSGVLTFPTVITS